MSYPNNHKHKFVVKDGDKAFPIIMCEECEFELDKEYYDGYVVPLERDYENLKEQFKILANTKHECVKELNELKANGGEAFKRGYEKAMKDAQERLHSKLVEDHIVEDFKKIWNEAINEASWWLAKKESYEGTLYSEQIKELMR